MRPAVLLLAVGVATGCIDPDADPPVAAVARCASGFCGSNSPIIDHYGFHDLGLDGQANAAGFVLLGMSQGDLQYEVDVQDSRLRGLAPGLAPLAGKDLVGAVLWLERAGDEFAIVIAGVGTVDEVVPPFGAVEAYRLDLSSVIGNLVTQIAPGKRFALMPVLSDLREALCPDTRAWPEGAQEWDEAAAMSPYDALVFEGDRIDAAARTVERTADTRWFNVGCAKDTLAKLRLTRSTMLTSAATDWKLVQATLKMLSADYCGTGMPFTVAGEPLVWRGHTGMAFLTTPGALEARWQADGAVCLDEPRLATTDSADALAQFPDIEKAIANECRRPPPCADSDPWIDTGEYVVTANW